MTAWEWLKARALWLLGILAALLPVIGYAVGRLHGARYERDRARAANTGALAETVLEDAAATEASVQREREAAQAHAAIEAEAERREAITRPTVADALAEHERAERLRRGGA